VPENRPSWAPDDRWQRHLELMTFSLGRQLVAGAGSERVWVQVIDVDAVAGREITFGRNLAEGLGDRADDIRAAIEAGSESVAKSLKSLDSPEGWTLGEVSASFGITLTAEAGVIVSKASAGATFEVSVKFTRAEP
jgi:Trypsin-co-occurring domain 1